MNLTDHFNACLYRIYQVPHFAIYCVLALALKLNVEVIIGSVKHPYIRANFKLRGLRRRFNGTRSSQ